MMHPAGYYALLVANGLSFASMIELVREEAELHWECDCSGLDFKDDDEAAM